MLFEDIPVRNTPKEKTMKTTKIFLAEFGKVFLEFVLVYAGIFLVLTNAKEFGIVSSEMLNMLDLYSNLGFQIIFFVMLIMIGYAMGRIFYKIIIEGLSAIFRKQ